MKTAHNNFIENYNLHEDQHELIQINVKSTTMLLCTEYFWH